MANALQAQRVARKAARDPEAAVDVKAWPTSNYMDKKCERDAALINEAARIVVEPEEEDDEDRPPTPEERADMQRILDEREEKLKAEREREAERCDAADEEWRDKANGRIVPEAEREEYAKSLLRAARALAEVKTAQTLPEPIKAALAADDGGPIRHKGTLPDIPGVAHYHGGARTFTPRWTNPDHKITPYLKAGDYAHTATFYRYFNKRTTLRRYQDVFVDWEGGAYREIEEDTIEAELREFLGRSWIDIIVGGVSTPAPVTVSNKLVSEIMAALRAECHLDRDAAAMPCWLGDNVGDRPRADECIAFPNGILHLPTRDFLPATPEFFTDNALDFDYDPNAPTPKRWLALLRTYWPDRGDLAGDRGDDDCIETLQEFFGYAVSPGMEHHRLLALPGPTRSGKGTLCRIGGRLVGLRNVTSLSFNDLPNTFGRQPLIGKRLGIIADLKIGKNMDTAAALGVVQNITGGDHQTIPRKMIASWSGVLRMKLIIAFNPPLSIGIDHTSAIFGRMVFVPMEHSFLGDEDQSIEDAITRHELPGIFLWALEGLERLKTRGRFLEPAKGKIAKRAMARHAAPVQAFVEDFATVAPELQASTDELYAAYVAWCHYVEGCPAVAKNIFGRNLAAVVGAKLKPTRIGGRVERQTGYSGIGLNDAGRAALAEGNAYLQAAAQGRRP